MSLSQEPVLSRLKARFVCGYRDITGEPWAGRSGIHQVGGNAVRTTNGAGPHNLQIFMLAADGTVLHALPGYWDPRDLVREMDLAERLAAVLADPSLSAQDKARRFGQMQLGHTLEHPPDMALRSRMQGFDMKFEARRRPTSSDRILDRDRVMRSVSNGERPPASAFKTTDRLMHERMAARPFLPYATFDVAAYADYGRPKYDKREDERDATGRRLPRGLGLSPLDPAFGGDPRPTRIARRTMAGGPGGLRPPGGVRGGAPLR